MTLPIRHVCVILLCAAFCWPLHAEAGQEIAEGQKGAIAQQNDARRSKLVELRKRETTSLDQYADAAVFTKAITWALRYETTLTPADVVLLSDAAKEASRRVTALEGGQFDLGARKGKLVRAYVSSVDDSVQPFGLVIPAGYDPKLPIRLDVVLHGSSKPVGMSELRFMQRFSESESKATVPPQVNYIELHPLGRVENCYRWSGETDVFEAIEAVCRNYNIDRQRIVLRGMSMGASGTWHLGLKHPDRFVALGPYCGYVDTYNFSKTDLPNFIKVDPLPPVQERALHMLDSIDYAANAAVVPAIACMGEKDVFFQAHVLMGEAMQREGLSMVNLISPGTGHVIDPVTHKEQMQRIAAFADRELRDSPKQLRFVTWTLKYNRCHWLQLLKLEEHYARAEIRAVVNDDGSVDINTLQNIAQLAILPPVLQEHKPIVRINGESISVPSPSDTSTIRRVVFRKKSGAWSYAGELNHIQLDGKRPGVQGPIDDAFTSKFLCVRGTGQPWNADVQKWSDGRLNQFASDWHRYFRGELPIKDDSEVTELDLQQCNIILFGDPGSNRWINRALPNLPFKWQKEYLAFGDKSYSSTTTAPACIYPSPFASNRYVVVNSGHSFGEKELSSLNYLLFPRHGDWAIFDATKPDPLAIGYFDEAWQVDHNRNPTRK